MRKHFLVKPAFQLRHLFWTVGIVTICFVTCYALFESLLNGAVRSGSLPLEVAAGIRSSFQLGFGLTFAILAMITGIENYLFFHRVAGPLYALEKSIRRISEGQMSERTRTRDGDQLGDLIQAFELMRTRIEERMGLQDRRIQLLTRELNDLLASSSVDTIDTLRRKIQEIRERVEQKAA